MGLELLHDIAAAKTLRTLRVNFTAAVAVREMFCQLRAVHAVHNYRVLRAAVPADVPDPTAVT
eukprot:5617966-Amphidinium_carterae.1